MTSIYHSGELAIQQRAGVQEAAKALSHNISQIVKPAAVEFLRTQRLAIASTVDTSDRVWASLLTGEPGFIQVVTGTVRIKAAPVNSDPLNENLRVRDDIGILAIHLATRRRLRLNGKAQVQPDGSIYVHPKQVYFNCPQYIQIRHLESDFAQPSIPSIQDRQTLSEEQQQKIAQVDTFFIASFHPDAGADASHRGGNPGFVKVLSANKLVFPDYSGNNMFQTLGNISLNPNTGLLFVDFERGNTLQLTGKAKVVWDADRVAEFTGALRVVEFEIDRVIAIAGATPLRWRFGQYSPFNPR
ncbi:pyridoxamine 5'-phosphate oxidase family protein [Trichocoleus sp. FACHB-90]|uniref:pyridoxamine 5'-phosphate oxidase family protein n=1 Tax=Cyanophyceae TaxID=3028117 RepID=UPI0016885E2F|nr:pyridoxamine 5'-phosphate oxidase family protein [Trichocoleus sp. FACHB-90]MBD1925839.1 pyridoxamine 5'-phosphate oxidase family protein [Trichocoleus sp. FACHB-90]